jgi:hypothetical protein
MQADNKSSNPPITETSQIGPVFRPRPCAAPNAMNTPAPFFWAHVLRALSKRLQKDARLFKKGTLDGPQVAVQSQIKENDHDH